MLKLPKAVNVEPVMLTVHVLLSVLPIFVVPFIVSTSTVTVPDVLFGNALIIAVIVVVSFKAIEFKSPCPVSVLTVVEPILTLTVCVKDVDFLLIVHVGLLPVEKLPKAVNVEARGMVSRVSVVLLTLTVPTYVPLKVALMTCEPPSVNVAVPLALCVMVLLVVCIVFSVMPLIEMLLFVDVVVPANTTVDALLECPDTIFDVPISPANFAVTVTVDVLLAMF